MTESTETRTVADLRLGPLGHGAANVGNLYHAMTDDEAWAVTARSGTRNRTEREAISRRAVVTATT